MILGDSTPNEAFMKKAKSKKIVVDFITSERKYVVTKENVGDLINQMDSFILFYNRTRFTKVWEIIRNDIKILGNE